VITSRAISLGIGDVLIFLDKIKTQVLCSITFFQKIMKFMRYVEKYGTAGHSMPFACWITWATDTLRIYNTYSFSTVALVSRPRLSFTLVHTVRVLLVDELMFHICACSDIQQPD
jgi:hypothetical protein